ncbi:MAG: hypothetical protein EZS28_023333 [Streblomastix strix]|uniref:Uncharacterized protein n=1 Tax=Streblomastix strix TaxID=222440 RepID=A0A5J4VF09_9EUKA|nr:MAG: hypothetical protein EZS28_023333 [Streblomastix strix]
MSNNADANLIFGFYPQYSEIRSSRSENYVDLIIVQNQQQEDFENQFDDESDKKEYFAQMNTFSQKHKRLSKESKNPYVSQKKNITSTYSNRSAHEIIDRTSEYTNWKQFIDSVGAIYVHEEEVSNMEGNLIRRMKSYQKGQEMYQQQDKENAGIGFTLFEKNTYDEES